MAVGVDAPTVGAEDTIDVGDTGEYGAIAVLRGIETIAVAEQSEVGKGASCLFQRGVEGEH